MTKKFWKWLMVLSLVGVITLEACLAKEAQQLTFALGVQPTTLDPGTAAEIAPAPILINTFEGLTRIDKHNKVTGGVAASWEISPDRLTYTFHLRKEAKWSDGVPVTANDFRYAWLRVLDPALGCDYVYYLKPYLKNAAKYYSKQCGAAEVGIEVKDSKTLVVTLEQPTSYMLELFSYFTYAPVRKDIVEKNPTGWYKDGHTFVCNGPFKLTNWKFNDSIILVKNENYWGKNRVKLAEVKFKFVSGADTALAAFEASNIDGTDNVPGIEMARLRTENKVTILPALKSYYLLFNNKIKPLDNLKVRQALTLAIDRSDIVTNVFKAGQMPATGVVPYGMNIAGKDFRRSGPNYDIKPTAQVGKAKQLLAEAGYPDGKGFPKFVLTFSGSSGLCEAIQQMWKKNLNIEVTLQGREWQVDIKETKQIHYELQRSGWTADYIHPMTFLDLFTSISGNNYTNWSDKEYDANIALAQKAVSPQKAAVYMHKAEDILIGQYRICPLYYNTFTVCMSPKVKGWRKSPLGFLYLDEAYKVK